MKLKILSAPSYDEIEEKYEKFKKEINKGVYTLMVKDVKLFETTGCITYHIFYTTKDEYGKEYR